MGHLLPSVAPCGKRLYRPKRLIDREAGASPIAANMDVCGRFAAGNGKRSGLRVIQLVVRKKRDLYEELMEGFDALADRRAGKRTLRTHTVRIRPAPRITPRELAKVRKDMKLSRGLFAGYLRTNVRTLENWEQGRAKPNAQAALLIRMVQRFPDTVRRLAEI